MLIKNINSKFHFIGIGGIGMCGLAELLHNVGASVSGSDLSQNANVDRLRELGIKVNIGHSTANIHGADVVVYSSAVKSDNPEFQEAKKLKIPLIPRAEALAETMRLRRGIAVAGTHGKTTTTSMTASIFLEANVGPTIVVGGRFEKIKSTARLGTGEWFIAEADESDGSFQKLSPEISIITNVDNDHMDFYHSFENLKKAFFEFASKIPYYGAVIVCGDNPETKKIFQEFYKKIIFYGFNSDNEYVLKGERGKYELYHESKKIGTIALQVPGRHNALNATAAIITGLNAGIDIQTCLRGIERFEGVDRRFQFKGEAANVKVYDDYGHHPTEVSAVLSAFREKFPKQRLVVYFQPHRYSRTQSCWKEFTACFSDSDLLFIGDIYPAGEKPIGNINSKQLASEIKAKVVKHLPSPSYLSSYENPHEFLASQISQELKSGDVFVTLGAGDGWKIGLEVINKLK